MEGLEDPMNRWSFLWAFLGFRVSTLNLQKDNFEWILGFIQPSLSRTTASSSSSSSDLNPKP
jgi:hypothetical protein